MDVEKPVRRCISCLGLCSGLKPQKFILSLLEAVSLKLRRELVPSGGSGGERVTCLYPGF